jgi:hypothetical protein
MAYYGLNLIGVDLDSLNMIMVIILAGELSHVVYVR